MSSLINEPALFGAVVVVIILFVPRCKYFLFPTNGVVLEDELIVEIVLEKLFLGLFTLEIEILDKSSPNGDDENGALKL